MHTSQHAAPAPMRRAGNAANFRRGKTADERHQIEQTVKVYLRLADGASRWIVDPTVVGYPLDSAHENLDA